MGAQIHPIVVGVTGANVAITAVPGIAGLNLQAALNSVGALLADQQDMLDAIEDALALPPGAVQVARVISDELYQTASATLTTVPGLVLELDTTDYGLQLDFYVSFLSSLMVAGGAVGLSVTVDGVSFENTTINSATAAALGYGAVLLSCAIPEGSGAAIEVEAQVLAVGGTAYVASDETSQSFLRAWRV